MAAWFTVRLADRPGALGRLATALGDRGVNVTGVVGVAEDTGGTLMLATSDEGATRSVLEELRLDFESHERASEAAGLDAVREGLARQGLDVEG
jgi:hypothetical protein